jgi:hypothetical protein
LASLASCLLLAMLVLKEGKTPNERRSQTQTSSELQRSDDQATSRERHRKQAFQFARGAIDTIGALSVLVGVIALLFSYRQLIDSHRGVEVAEAALRPSFSLEAIEQRTSDGRSRLTLRLINTSGAPTDIVTELASYAIVRTPGGLNTQLPVIAPDYWIRVDPQGGEVARWVNDMTWLDGAERAFNPRWRPHRRLHAPNAQRFIGGAALISVQFTDPLGAEHFRYFAVTDSSQPAAEDFVPGEFPVEIMTEQEMDNCKGIANSVMTQIEFAEVWKVSAPSSPDEIQSTRKLVRQLEQAAKSLPRGSSPCYVLGVVSVA